MARLTPINPDSTLHEMMRRWPETVGVFLRHQMLCVGCPINPLHTLADACAEYGLDEAVILAELQAAADNSVILARAPSARAGHRP